MNNTTINPTKKDLIVNAIQNMDIAMLEVLLDDDKIYSETTKAIFLRELGKLFKKHFSDDTFLNTYEGSCPLQGCFKGCRGFRFEGNQSINSMNLIFEEKAGEIINIELCDRFQPDDKNILDNEDEDFKMGYSKFPVYLDIKENEKVNLKHRE